MSKILEEYEGVKIIQEDEEQMPFYLLMPPDFTSDEKKILSNVRNLVSDYSKVMHKLSKIHTSSEKEEFLRKYLRDQIDKKNVKTQNLEELITRIMDELFLGYGKIGPLMRDEELEEIMINGVKDPVFVVHRKHGMCITNITFESVDPIREMVSWLANYVDRRLDEETPLLDAHMPDGSRANVAVAPAAPYGPAITIRKFRKVPFTILDLIDIGTLNFELAAFLWVCVEGLGIAPRDLLISGGAGSGKTTLMNALAMFIPLKERIITVEDTLELNFDFIENWVPLEATPIGGKSGSNLTMHDLLKNTLRMRPDRVIVGEVRGKEAETLFVAMDIGLDGSMGTIHANNARETTIRLADEPMAVPLRMLPLLDLIIVTNRIYDRSRGLIRRITQVAEVAGVEKDVVQLGEIYAWDVNTDEIVRSDFPILLSEEIAKKCGITKKRLNKEFLIREKVLRYMMDKKIRKQNDVLAMFQTYHRDPLSVINKIKQSGGLTSEG